jgi:hypothetical protein
MWNRLPLFKPRMIMLSHDTIVGMILYAMMSFIKA